MITRRKKLRKPKPGIYHGVPFEEYQAWPYVNNSSLAPALKSGLHYQASLARERKGPNREMLIGSMVHCLYLEPDTFDERFVAVPGFRVLEAMKAPKRSAAYKSQRARWERSQNGKVIVEPDDMATARECAEHLRGRVHDWHGPGRQEVSIVGDCPETKLRLKARIDYLTELTIIELKTCRDASRFHYDIVDYGYHRQAAFYQDIVSWRTGKLLPFVIIAIETSEPWGIRYGQIDQALLEAGRREVMVALRRIKHGLETGEWQSYENPVTWRLPWDRAIELQVGGEQMVMR